MDASEPRNLAPELPARLTPKPRWLLNRLRCMTPAEVAFRGARALQAHAERLGLKAGALDDKTRALFGVEAEERYAALDARKTRLPLRQTFPEGGYYVLGCEFDTPEEIRLVADAGALGYRSIAAHGHADALSFTLSAGGREFLIDPGTYAYHTQGAWRSYFRGTSAHNTVCIDGEDQSVQGGSFMWLKKANAGCSLWLSSAEKDCFEGWHDGYRRLDDPVKHRRLIELDKRAPHRGRGHAGDGRRPRGGALLPLPRREPGWRPRRRLRGTPRRGFPADHAASHPGREARALDGRPGAHVRLGFARLRLPPAGADHRVARTPDRTQRAAHRDRGEVGAMAIAFALPRA